MSLTIGPNGGMMTTVGKIANCPFGNTCTFTGFWQESIAPIPEPSTAVLLLSALALGLAVRVKARSVAGRPARP